jgi:transcriptional regulator with XRE-family HTH domain
MTLLEYLATRQLTEAAFARRLNVPASTVHRWVRGKRLPKVVSLRRIARATGGKVKLNDFYPEPEAAE